jgi:hypothetical protein
VPRQIWNWFLTCNTLHKRTACLVLEPISIQRVRERFDIELKFNSSYLIFTSRRSLRLCFGGILPEPLKVIQSHKTAKQFELLAAPMLPVIRLVLIMMLSPISCSLISTRVFLLVLKPRTWKNIASVVSSCIPNFWLQVLLV